MLQLSYQWERWRVSRQLNKLVKKFNGEIRKARSDKARVKDVEHIIDQAQFETREYVEELEKMHSRYLINLANRMLLPTPEWDDTEAWQESEFDGSKYLSFKGRRSLYLAIRNERKERLEIWKGWLTGLTGLLGVLTGILAIWLKK
jgi:hypothetical protein